MTDAERTDARTTPHGAVWRVVHDGVALGRVFEPSQEHLDDPGFAVNGAAASCAEPYCDWINPDGQTAGEATTALEAHSLGAHG